MKILFDFISVQGFINGGAEHTKCILNALHGQKKSRDIELIALYDSKIAFIGDDRKHFEPYFFSWADIRKIPSIGAYCKQESIDVFYVGIGQRLLSRKLVDIECRVVMVIHDIVHAENERSILSSGSNYIRFKAFVYRMLGKAYLWRKNFGGSDIELFTNQETFLKKNNVQIVTVSNFSKISIQYNFPFLKGKGIHVFFFSPAPGSFHSGKRTDQKPACRKQEIFCNAES